MLTQEPDTRGLLAGLEWWNLATATGQRARGTALNTR
jgi:hypothetical protein